MELDLPDPDQRSPDPQVLLATDQQVLLDLPDPDQRSPDLLDPQDMVQLDRRACMGFREIRAYKEQADRLDRRVYRGYREYRD
jgi:hypothetical protein